MSDLIVLQSRLCSWCISFIEYLRQLLERSKTLNWEEQYYSMALRRGVSLVVWDAGLFSSFGCGGGENNTDEIKNNIIS